MTNLATLKSVILECLGRARLPSVGQGSRKNVEGLDSRLRGNDAIALFLLLFLISPSQAEFLVGPGATGSSFLKIPVSARATGMAGSFTAVAGDVGAMEYNPAGLSEIYRTDINATLIRHIEESKIQAFSVAYPFAFKKNVGTGDGFFGPDSNKLFLGLHYRSFQADDLGRDIAGVPTGEFDIKDQLIQLGAAYTPFERLSLGLSGKIISSKLAGESLGNRALDGGFLWKLSAITTVGASFLNFGPDKAFISEADPLPTLLRAGLAIQTKRILVAADLLTGRDKITKESLGVEISPNSILKIRGGILNATNLEFAGGVGLLFSPTMKTSSRPEKERKKNKRILDDLDISSENPVYKQYGANDKFSKPLDFGVDYALRTHEDLNVSHTITLKILY